MECKNDVLSGKDFIVFSDDWGRHPFSCQHLMKVFLDGNRVLWVNTIGMRYPNLSLYDLKRSLGKIVDWIGSSGESEIVESLRVISPFMIPYNNISMIRLFNKISVVSAVKKVVKEEGFVDPIVIITVPNAADYVGCLGESLAVYYCVDKFSEWPGVARDLVLDMEAGLLDRVDFVVASSSALASEKLCSRGATYLMPHGVDVDHFEKAWRVAPHSKFAGIGARVVGYYGLIDERMDLGLLQAVLERLPDVAVVLIGGCKISLDGLKEYANFHHLGAVSYDELPSCLAAFDVAVIPYLRTELSNNINPLKLREYLAAGVPVVSTALPEVEKYSDCVRVADGADLFVDAIEQALEAGKLRVGDVNIMRSESWLERAKMLSGWMCNCLEMKRGSGDRA